MAVPKWVPAFFLLLVAAQANAQSSVAVSLETPDSLYAVPTEQDRLGRVLAPVHIDGHGPFRFLVDTGSTGTFVGTALAAQLGISPATDGTAPQLRIHDVMGTVNAPAIHLNRLDFGRFASTNISVPMLPIRDASGAVGVIGVEGLKDRQLAVDFLHDIIRIEPSGQRIPPSYDAMAAQTDKNGLMVVKVELDGVLAPALIDTGAERTVINPAMLQAIIASGSHPVSVGEARLVNLFGVKVTGTYLELDKLRLGPYTVMNLPIVLVAAQLFESWGYAETPAVVLGMDILGRADGLVLDFGHGELYFSFPTAYSPVRMH